MIVVHTPVHASWLNQAEIYHSIIERKVLAPNDFESTAEVARTLNEFEHHYNRIAKPFEWSFTNQDLAATTPTARQRALLGPASSTRGLTATLLRQGPLSSRL